MTKIGEMRNYTSSKDATVAVGHVSPSVNRLRLFCWLAAAGLVVVKLFQIDKLSQYHWYHSNGPVLVAPPPSIEQSTRLTTKEVAWISKHDFDVLQNSSADIIAADAGERQGKYPLSLKNGHGDKLYRKHPRIIAIEYTHRTLTGISHLLVNPKVTKQFRFQIGSIPHMHHKQKVQAKVQQQKLSHQDWNTTRHIDGDDSSSGKCKPMYDWQLSSFPNCNSFHELDVTQMRMINKGGFRIAFEMNEVLDGKESKYVYKTMKYGKKINGISLKLQRRDGLVLERTTKSNFIPDIHGFCGLAALMDYMPEGDMHDYIKGARIAGGSTLAPVDKLKIAIHIASAVADLHTIDGTETPSFFHNDIFPHQYLFQDGYWKLNDFHIAKPIYINKKTKAPCPRDGFGVGVRKNRSLEQHQRGLKHPDFKPVNPDKTDVWMMGNLIYTIGTDLYLFEKPRNLNCTETSIALVNGRRSPYPDHIEKSNDPSYLAIKKAVEMCWTHDSLERPSARAVTEYLMQKLREITTEDDPDLRVVLPERDEDQPLTSSDYNRYNYD
mmetsp:Transcript_2328/g.4154  ORF Transcript_2328/g.4154 Transcript_2328/m.4154 type:complete len:550 (-) Transcript_2328:226-1875(-)|eukprot:CAMPEP_0202004308 /NCGR_PEP_ID=MMETSP0905-20130828/9628_1 /ASSEMBLY_ACC=CAM_ASM_000554 /TAXON_ID=420261 /ORGANISM="Thalassiosira antarctica, Strain CCMP982" /LENGTH=549 /DNA_ID=CAMNT_0048561599 /DNA_START=119 /DNA_END=1768 /DNA_ORIENTATION=-